MNISLHQTASIENVLVSYYQDMEYLDVVENDLSSTIDTLLQIDALQRAINKHGVTQSIETLFGDNFSSTASMESEVTEVKQNLFQRTWLRIKMWVVKFINWIKGFFTGYNAIIKKLRETRDIVSSDSSLKYPIIVYNTPAIMETIRHACYKEMVELQAAAARRKSQSGEDALTETYAEFRQIQQRSMKQYITLRDYETLSVKDKTTLLQLIDMQIKFLNNTHDDMVRSQKKLEQDILKGSDPSAIDKVITGITNTVVAMQYRDTFKLLIRCSLNLISNVNAAVK